MIATLRAFGALTGDALIAAGVLLSERCDNSGPPYYFDDCPDDDHRRPAPAIPAAEVRSVLDELPDSTLLGMAATVIAGWKPILLSTLADLTDVDVLVAALRDRAAQFRAIEGDAAEPFLTVDHLTRTLHT